MISRILAVLASLTRGERRILSISASVFFVSILVLLLNLYFFGTAVVAQSGGRFVEGSIGQPSAVNPVLGSVQEIDQELIELMFADITELSDSIEHSEDGKEWAIVLKRDLFWSDGEPLTVDDVLFTVGLIQNRELASPLASSWKGVDVVKISDNELLISLQTPYRYFDTTLTNLHPVPAHIFASIPVSNIRLSSYNLSPVSSGPFRFDELEQDKNGFIKSYTLVRNEHFSLGSPYLKEFEFRFYNRFKDAVAVFNRGFLDGLGGFDPESIMDVSGDFELFELSVPRYYAVFMNSSSNAALKDDAVRTVLTRSVDTEGLIEDVFNSSALPAFGPIPSTVDGFDADVYDDSTLSASDARKLLEEAGFEKNEDGIYANDDVVLEFDLIAPDIDFLQESALQLQSQFKDIGITINPIILSSSVISSEIIRSRDYELLLFGNVLRGNADVFSFWHSSQRFYPGLNLSLFENADLDLALEESRSTFDDDKYAATVREIQEIVFEENGALFLYSPFYRYALNPNIKGVELDSVVQSWDRFDGAKDWYKKERRVLK